MAYASVETKKILKTTVVEENVVELTLTPQEAETIRAVLGYVGGCPDSSRRKHVVSIDSALYEAGVDYNSTDVEPNGSIYFTKS